MTKRDEEDLGLALVSGGVGALLGYGKATNKIQNLELQIRQLQNENTMLRGNISLKDAIISDLQTENKKLKEVKKDKLSVKNITKSLFDKI